MPARYNQSHPATAPRSSEINTQTGTASTAAIAVIAPISAHECTPVSRRCFTVRKYIAKNTTLTDRESVAGEGRARGLAGSDVRPR